MNFTAKKEDDKMHQLHDFLCVVLSPPCVVDVGAAAIWLQFVGLLVVGSRTVVVVSHDAFLLLLIFY